MNKKRFSFTVDTFKVKPAKTHVNILTADINAASATSEVRPHETLALSKPDSCYRH